ncbi:hypothetical protein LY78DRAFT_146586 [Colletotrichum sublineola]|nr:hypothetical protein LY78DRAFT_146586 [Colletotrichum sublineola]
MYIGSGLGHEVYLLLQLYLSAFLRLESAHSFSFSEFPANSTPPRAPCSACDDHDDDAWLSLLVREERREKNDTSIVLLAVECLRDSGSP